MKHPSRSHKTQKNSTPIIYQQPVVLYTSKKNVNGRKLLNRPSAKSSSSDDLHPNYLLVALVLNTSRIICKTDHDVTHQRRHQGRMDLVPVIYRQLLHFTPREYVNDHDVTHPTSRQSHTNLTPVIFQLQPLQLDNTFKKWKLSKNELCHPPTKVITLSRPWPRLFDFVVTPI